MQNHKNFAIGTFKDGKYEAAITYYVVEVEAQRLYPDETVKEVTFEYRDGKVGVIECLLSATNQTEPEVTTDRR